MQTILELENPDDFVFATGKLTSIRDFMSIAASAAGFEPVFENSGTEEICYDRKSGLRLAQISQSYIRPFDTPPLVGNASRLREKTGWSGSRPIENIAAEMIEADLDRRKKGMLNV
jgi:GDPmannose 4,6-dehydratase